MGVDPITVLPYDILPNIFSQLPAIEIVRLQAVSRKWKTAINRLCTATWARRSLSPRDAEWRCEGGWDEFVGSGTVTLVAPCKCYGKHQSLEH